MTKVRLYSSYLTPDKNIFVPDFQKGLTDGDEFDKFYKATEVPEHHSVSKYWDNFNYIKIGLDITIKVKLNEGERLTLPLNYCLIQNGTFLDSTVVYKYFVTKTEWISQDTVKFYLSMDTLNTFWASQTYENFDWSKTKVTRAHKDRFHNNANWDADNDNYQYVDRIVDKSSEGLDITTQFKSSSLQINKTGDENNLNLNQKWYLVYQSANVENSGAWSGAINCYIVPEIDTRMGLGGTSEPQVQPEVNWKSSDFADNEFRVLIVDDQVGASNTWVNANPRFSSSNYHWDVNSTRCVVFFKNGNALNRIYGYIDAGGAISFPSDGSTYRWLQGNDTIPIYNVLAYRRFFHKPWEFGVTSGQAAPGSGLSTVAQAKTMDLIYFSAGSTQVYTLDGIKKWDRTDSKLVKIIELPYYPFNSQMIDASTIKLPDYACQIEDNTKMKLKDLSYQFSSVLEAKIVNELSARIPAKTDRYTSTNKPYFESKLFHSDFYTRKYVYDSFSLDKRCESYDTVNGTPMENINFVPSSNISSKLLFDISNNMYESMQDYENILVSTRNNEYPIFTSQYLNYMRTGYNNDKKKVEQQQTGNWIKTGLLTAGAIGSILAAIPTGGASLSVTAAATATLATGGAVSSWYNTISSNAQADRDLATKLATLQEQSNTISTADDLSLLNYYNGNKLYLFKYEVSEATKESVYQLFRNCGYKLNDPTISAKTQYNNLFFGRRNFNFIEMSPVYDHDKFNYDNMVEFEEDMKARWQSGVTIMHKHYLTDTNRTYAYDWDKKYENWETWILGTED